MGINHELPSVDFDFYFEFLGWSLASMSLHEQDRHCSADGLNLVHSTRSIFCVEKVVVMFFKGSR